MPFVRSATLLDLPALQAFDQMHEATAEAINAGTCIVAGFDDAVLAYAIIARTFFTRRFVEIIFVHPDQRRKGLADALLAFAEAQSQDEALWISTAVGNFPMQSVLHRRGYEHSGVVHHLAKVPELIYHKPPATK